MGFSYLAVSGLTVRLPVWPWQQVCVKRVRKWGVRATWIFIMTSPVYWLQRGGHTQVKLFGPPESTVNWPWRRREEGGSEHIAHIRVIQVLPVADNWIDEDGFSRTSYWVHLTIKIKLSPYSNFYITHEAYLTKIKSSSHIGYKHAW